MTDFPINVVVDPTGAKQGSAVVQNELHAMETGADRLRVALEGAFSFLGIGFGVRELVAASDEFTTIENRLRGVTKGEEDLTAVTKQLVDVANQTRSSFAGTAETFERLALAGDDLGVSQQEIIQFTKQLNEAVAISGKTSEETQGAVNLFANGLANGSVQGRQLIQILRQVPEVTAILTESLHVSREQLLELGQAGKLSTDLIIKAFADADAELSQKFAKTVPTVGQAMTVLHNSFLVLVGDAEKSTGVMALLSQGIIFVANNMGILVSAVLAGAAGLAAAFGPGLVGALSISNVGIAAIVGTVGYLVNEIYELQKAEDALAEAQKKSEWALLQEAITATTNRIKELEAQETHSVDAELRRIAAVDAQTAKLQGLNAELEKHKVHLSDNENGAKGAGVAFDQLVKHLGDEASILQLSNREHAIQAELLKDIETITKNGSRPISPQQREELEALIRSNAALKERQALINSIKDPEENRVKDLNLLNDLLDHGTISQDQYNVELDKQYGLFGGAAQAAEKYRQGLDALSKAQNLTPEDRTRAFDELTVKGLASSHQLEDGFTRAFAKMSLEANDFAKLAESVINKFADDATNSIVQFAETGKFSFASFADSLVNDILKIITRMLVLQAIEAAVGVFGGGAAGVAAGAIGGAAGTRAEGGPVLSGHSYLVGEKGPELFTPSQNGVVSSNQQTMQQPQVNLQVVNVDDPRHVPQVISSGSADQAILNVLARNKDKVKQTIS